MSEASVFAATVALAPEAGAADGRASGAEQDSASGAEEDSARTGAGVQDASPASRHLLAAATNSSNSSQAPVLSFLRPPSPCAIDFGVCEAHPTFRGSAGSFGVQLAARLVTTLALPGSFRV